MADNGRVDGEMERVYDYNTSHPNLVRIEEPLKIVKFIALAIDQKRGIRWSEYSHSGSYGKNSHIRISS